MASQAQTVVSINRSIGQTVVVPAPAAGAAVIVESSAGGTLNLTFDPTVGVSFDRSGNDLTITSDNGGKVTIAYFFAVGDEGLPEMRLPDGTKLPSEDLLTKLNDDMDLTTAAGPAADSNSGLSEYDGNAGDLLNGVNREGSLGTDQWGHSTQSTLEVKGLGATTGTASSPAAAGNGGVTPSAEALQYIARGVMYTQNAGDLPQLQVNLLAYDNAGGMAQKAPALPGSVNLAFFDAQGYAIAAPMTWAYDDTTGKIIFSAPTSLSAVVYCTITDNGNGQTYSMQLVLTEDKYFDSGAQDAATPPFAGHLAYGEWHSGRDTADSADYTVTSSNLADTLTFTGNMLHADINTADGNDTMTANGDVSSSTIALGAGDDSAAFTGSLTDTTVAAGEGDNMVSITGAVTGSSITAEAGKDLLTVTGDVLDSRITAGLGQDTVVVNGNVAASVVSLGAADSAADTDDADNNSLLVTGNVRGSAIYGTQGNDSVTVQGLTINSSVTMGENASAVDLQSGVRVSDGAAHDIILASGTLDINSTAKTTLGVSTSGADSATYIEAGDAVVRIGAAGGAGDAQTAGLLASAGGNNSLSTTATVSITTSGVGGNTVAGMLADNGSNLISGANAVNITGNDAGIASANGGVNTVDRVGALTIHMSETDAGGYSPVGVYSAGADSANVITGRGAGSVFSVVTSANPGTASTAYHHGVQTNGLAEISGFDTISIDVSGASFENTAVQSQASGLTHITGTGRDSELILNVHGAATDNNSGLRGYESGNTLVEGFGHISITATGATNNYSMVTMTNVQDATNEIRGLKTSDVITLNGGIKSYSAGGKNLINAGGGDDTLTLNGDVAGWDIATNKNNRIDMGTGNDSVAISGKLSAGTLIGGTGSDGMSIGGSVVNSVVALGTSVIGADTQGAGDSDTLTVGGTVNNSLIYGSAGQDVITTGSIYNGTVINTGAGADNISIGNDTASLVIAGAGNDTVFTRTLSAGAVIALGRTATADTLGVNDIDTLTILQATGTTLAMDASFVYGDAGTDNITVTGVIQNNSLISTGGGADSISVGTVTNSRIDAGTGNDTISGGVMTNAVIIAGLGSDSVTLTSVSGGVVALGNDTLGPGGGGKGEVDTLKITGATSSAAIYGDDGVDNVTLAGVTGSTINVGAGNDNITAGNIASSTVIAGLGNDTLTLGSLTAGTIVALGTSTTGADTLGTNYEDKLTINGTVTGSYIYGDAGSDIVTVSQNIGITTGGASFMDLGAGADSLTILGTGGLIGGSVVNMGTGDDYAHITGGMNQSTLIMGLGNDTAVLDGYASGIIAMGSSTTGANTLGAGDVDHLTINKMGGQASSNLTIYGDAGTDIVTVNGDFKYSSAYLGAGDDSICINGAVTGSGSGPVYLNGGAGFDIISVTNPANLTAANVNVSGFEDLHQSVGASSSATYNLSDWINTATLLNNRGNAIGTLGIDIAGDYSGGTINGYHTSIGSNITSNEFNISGNFSGSINAAGATSGSDTAHIGGNVAGNITFGGGNDLLSMHGYTSGSLVGGGGNDTLSFSLDNQAGTALKSGGSFSAFLTGGTHASGFETLMLDLSGGHNDTLTIDSTSITNLRNAMGGAVNDILIKGDHAGGTGGQDVVQFDNSSHTWSQNSADTSHAGYNSWHDDQGHTVYVDQQLAVAFIGG